AISAHGWLSLRDSRSVATATLSGEIDTANRIEDFNESIVLLLNADRDAHQALIAEKKAVTATSPDALKAADEENSSNLKQITDRSALAASVFNDEMNEIYAALQKDLAAWQRQSRAVLEAVRSGADAATIEAAHARSAT